MQVVLLERIEKLGQMGDVVKVKPGFARNYLLPRKKALRATAENLKSFEERRIQLDADNIQRRREAEDMSGRMADLFIVLVRQAGDAGNLYGSVSARDIAESVTGAGFVIERRQVKLDKPIKTLGLHSVTIVLHPEVSVDIAANVARSQEEAKLQTERGAAAPSTDDDDESDEPEIASEEGALELAAADAEPEESPVEGGDAKPAANA